jgi:hypothetical protein
MREIPPLDLDIRGEPSRKEDGLALLCPPRSMDEPGSSSAEQGPARTIGKTSFEHFSSYKEEKYRVLSRPR